MLKRLSFVSLLLAPGLALAQAIDIGAPSSGPFARIAAFFQDLVDLIGGPGALAVTFISLILAVGMWVAIPKAGAALGWILRVLIGGVVILNAAIWITWMQSGS